MEEAGDDRSGGSLVPGRRGERVRLGERTRWVGRHRAGRNQQEPQNAARVAQRKVLCHHAAHRAADQHDLHEAATIEQRRQCVGEARHGVGPSFPRGRPEAGKIRGKRADPEGGEPIERRRPIGR